MKFSNIFFLMFLGALTSCAQWLNQDDLVGTYKAIHIQRENGKVSTNNSESNGFAVQRLNEEIQFVKLESMNPDLINLF